MRFVITAADGHHLRSESVSSASEGVEAAAKLNQDGFAVILILDSLYRELTLAELRKRAIIEAHLQPPEAPTSRTRFERESEQQ